MGSYTSLDVQLNEEEAAKLSLFYVGSIYHEFLVELNKISIQNKETQMELTWLVMVFIVLLVIVFFIIKQLNKLISSHLNLDPLIQYKTPFIL